MAGPRRRPCSTTLEQLPRRQVEYRGQDLSELDLDALLARKPGIALIDELAHTNAPGSRHPKRWQDVVEVLDAGIDVVTTLNIQHVESLNDVVARITGVRVQETVPDQILQRADADRADRPAAGGADQAPARTARSMCRSRSARRSTTSSARAS